MSTRPDAGMMALFTQLASLNPKQRKDAAAQLIHRLKSEPELTSNVDYALKRLVKGLGSSRDGARLGFSLALTEVC